MAENVKYASFLPGRRRSAADFSSLADSSAKSVPVFHSMSEIKQHLRRHWDKIRPVVVLITASASASCREYKPKFLALAEKEEKNYFFVIEEDGDMVSTIPSEILPMLFIKDARENVGVSIARPESAADLKEALADIFIPPEVQIERSMQRAIASRPKNFLLFGADAKWGTEGPKLHADLSWLRSFPDFYYLGLKGGIGWRPSGGVAAEAGGRLIKSRFVFDAGIGRRFSDGFFAGYQAGVRVFNFWNARIYASVDFEHALSDPSRWIVEAGPKVFW